MLGTSLRFPWAPQVALQLPHLAFITHAFITHAFSATKQNEPGSAQLVSPFCSLRPRRPSRAPFRERAEGAKRPEGGGGGPRRIHFAGGGVCLRPLKPKTD